MKNDVPPYIRELLEYARLAPSVHNTQPWKFQVSDDTVALYIEPQRALGEGDPTGRELWISMGCLLETLLQAASGLGLGATVTHLQTNSVNEPLATIILKQHQQTPQEELLAAIRNRRSFRGHMRHEQVGEALLSDIQDFIKDLDSTEVVLTDDSRVVKTVAELSTKGMQLALNSPPFRKELAKLIHYNWTLSRTGMPGYSLGKGALGSIWEKWSVFFGLNNKKKAIADGDKIKNAGSVGLIFAKGDVPKYWLDAGRTYTRLVLTLTRAGYAHSTLASVVEASSFHEDIEAATGNHGRLQVLIRVGKPAKGERAQKQTPRLPVEDLLVT